MDYYQPLEKHLKQLKILFFLIGKKQLKILKVHMLVMCMPYHLFIGQVGRKQATSLNSATTVAPMNIL